VKIEIEDNLITLRYKDKEKYKDDKEENREIVDNTIEYEDEYIINIIQKGGVK